MADFNLMDFIKKQGADLAGLPVDLMNLLGTPVVNAARNVSAVSKGEKIPEPKKEITRTGSSEDIRKRAGVSTEDSILELILSLATPGPTELGKLGGLGAGIIAGRKASEVLGVEKVLDKAEEMRDAGKSQHKIAQETSRDLQQMRNPGNAMSVFIGPDNKPRLVIGNQGARIASGKYEQILKEYPEIYPLFDGSTAKLSDVLLHPSLYDISQRAATANLVVDKSMDAAAMYSPSKNLVSVGGKLIVPSSLRNDPQETALRTLLHEGGHAVQVEEGHRLGTADSAMALNYSIAEAIDAGSFTPNQVLYQMQKDLRAKSVFPNIADMLYSKEFEKLYSNNYGEWEAELGSIMNPTTFPMMYERGRTW